MTEEINHEENIGLLSRSRNMDQAYEEYRKILSGRKKGKISPLVKGMEGILASDSPDGQVLENMLMNATPQAIEDQVNDYQSRHIEGFKKAVKDSGDEITERYCSLTEALIGETLENAKDQLKDRLKEIPKDKHDDVLRPIIYKEVASILLRQLKPQDDESKKLLGLYLDEDATPEEQYDLTSEYLQRQGFNSNAINLVNPTEVAKNLREMHLRVIAEKIIKDDYTVDRDKFQEIYGNFENYRRIAPVLLEAENAS